MTVVYIDDNEDDISIFTRAISKLEIPISLYSFTDARDGIDFLHQVATLPDFVFLDINMPGLNGKQTLQIIRTNARFASLPVIMYSTSQIEQEIMECYQAGASGFVLKKDQLREIQSDLSRALGLMK